MQLSYCGVSGEVGLLIYAQEFRERDDLQKLLDGALLQKTQTKTP
jgi:hypothetical protein